MPESEFVWATFFGRLNLTFWPRVDLPWGDAKANDNPAAPYTPSADVFLPGSSEDWLEIESWSEQRHVELAGIETLFALSWLDRRHSKSPRHISPPLTGEHHRMRALRQVRQRGNDPCRAEPLWAVRLRCPTRRPTRRPAQRHHQVLGVRALLPFTQIGVAAGGSSQPAARTGHGRHRHAPPVEDEAIMPRTARAA